MKSFYEKVPHFMCRISIIQRHRINSLHREYLVLFRNFHFSIFSRAAEHWSDPIRIRALLPGALVACSARQAYRWFYSSIPCTAVIPFNITKGLDERIPLLLPTEHGHLHRLWMIIRRYFAQTPWYEYNVR